uniref:Uncharacterized protein n=1 Tax=Aotus nancymaae TaxID=37293 RepID=A0A2K5C8G0_AOTNA
TLGSELKCFGWVLWRGVTVGGLLIFIFEELYLQYFDLAGFLLLVLCLEPFPYDIKSNCSIPLPCGLRIYLFFKINHVSWA